ncbi:MULTISPECIES: tetratricopeptide repeat protein [unclassified Pseudoalteromonas]|uniref:tetratricopeptide repeat protein n=1 Tax=unclassified Pseudoalteromonas TaxID=194690 RepID=UPI0005A7F203|nr:MULTISPECIES: tetratricopeptide repeat protein [unclassified Pseudoalteromonas]
MFKYFAFFILSLLSLSVFADCKSEFEKGNFVEAFGVCQKESLNDASPDAQFIMAKIYAKGLGVGRDTTQAINYLSQAAQNGHIEGMFNLGMAFELGKGVDKNINAAFEWQLKAAQKGWLKAQRKIATMYEHGRGVNSDPIEAYNWYQKAAEQGDADSQLELGAIYMQGISLPSKVIPRDSEKGLHWIRKSANQNNAEAQFALASLIIDEKTAEGIEFYKKSAKNGNKFSMHNLASIYLKGDIVEKDLVTSKYYAQMALDVGQKSSQSILDHINKIEGITTQTASVEKEEPVSVHSNNKELVVNKPINDITPIVLETAPTDNTLISLLETSNYIIQLASMEKQASVNAFIKKYNIKDKTHILYLSNKNRYLVLSKPKEFLTQARALQNELNEILSGTSWLRKTPDILSLIQE